MVTRGMCIHEKSMTGMNHYCPRCLGLLAAVLSKQAMIHGWNGRSIL